MSSNMRNSLLRNTNKKGKIFLWEKSEKNMTCFSDLSLRNTFCVSVEKTLWKPHDMSMNGFFQGKQHLAPAVSIKSRYTFCFFQLSVAF